MDDGIHIGGDRFVGFSSLKSKSWYTVQLGRRRDPHSRPLSWPWGSNGIDVISKMPIILDKISHHIIDRLCFSRAFQRTRLLVLSRIPIIFR
jgi:hypothetical protein